MNIEAGGIDLEAEASPPRSARDPVVILAHPHPQMGGDMHNKVIDGIFRRSLERGWGAVRFNFRGVGKSTGGFDGGVGETEDLLGVITWASANFNVPIRMATIAGYSFGAWVGARAAARLPDLKRLVLIAPPVNLFDFSPLAGVTHSKHVFAAERDEIVPLAAVEQWFSKLTAPKALTVVRDADHAFVGQTAELLRSVLRTIQD
ncbi:MAG: CocE/NonD family hydrolase [Pseudomonadota bacterium]